MDSGRDLEKAFWRGNRHGKDSDWNDYWPTESKGDGKIRKNNLKTGGAQGKASSIRKAPCRLCGFPNDLSKIDHSGGSIDGNGAGGDITTAVASTTLPNGTVHTENYGSQAYRNAAGCALCFSKNSTKIRRDPQEDINPWDNIRNHGF